MKDKARKLELQRAWRAANREHVNAQRRDYYAKDPEKGRSISSKWRKQNPDKVNAQQRAAYERNPDKFRELARKNQKKYIGKYNANSARRHARKLNATPSWANKSLIDAAYEMAARKTQETGMKWHVDHIIPLQSKIVCGLHVESNLQVIPAKENLKKSNKLSYMVVEV